MDTAPPDYRIADFLSDSKVEKLESAQRIVELSEDERVLLGYIHAAGRPVAVHSFFRRMNAESGERSLERQLELADVYVNLWERCLIRVVVSANGVEPDQMVPTEAGVASLQAAQATP